MPTLLAVNLTLSSSPMFMPGLYLSIKLRYCRCACTYLTNSLAAASRAAVWASSVAARAAEEAFVIWEEAEEVSAREAAVRADFGGVVVVGLDV